jgi:hypothetical protein
MSRSRRPLLLGPLGAGLLALSAAGTALAGPEASVSVFNADGTPAGATGFYVQFNPLPGGETGSWEIWNSSGTMVADGDYEVTGTDADREPDTGVFDLPNGTYSFIWDDETPIDDSRGRLTIEVACATDTPAPTGTPFQSLAGETDAPTGTPFQSPGGETDAPTSVQSVAGETDAPPTLPDTTALETGRPDSAIWPGIIVIAFSLLAAILVLTPNPRRRNR